MLRRVALSLSVAVAVVLATCTNTLATAVAIGERAPDFKAIGVDGKEYSLDSAKGAKAVVVCFTCNNCPVAKSYEDRFIEFCKKYKTKGVKFLAINVNETENLQAMKERAEKKGFNFPYLYDASGEAARAYGAKVTPHIFILDQARTVAYMGSFDDRMTGPTRHFVVDAVEAVLAGKKPERPVTKEFGCSIMPRTQ